MIHDVCVLVHIHVCVDVWAAGDKKINNGAEKMATAEDRSYPNILITGTPGTGKTCTSELVAEMTGFKHINVGSLVGFFTSRFRKKKKSSKTSTKNDF